MNANRADFPARALCRSNTPGRATARLGERLFASLDLDGNAQLSFKEFLVGLERMVMEEYDEEDEEDKSSDDLLRRRRLHRRPPSRIRGPRE